MKRSPPSKHRNGIIEPCRNKPMPQQTTQQPNKRSMQNHASSTSTLMGKRPRMKIHLHQTSSHTRKRTVQRRRRSCSGTTTTLGTCHSPNYNKWQRTEYCRNNWRSVTSQCARHAISPKQRSEHGAQGRRKTGRTRHLQANQAWLCRLTSWYHPLQDSWHR